MKILKLSLLAAAAALVVGTGTAARADGIADLVPDGTYTFHATDGDTALDGSSITFQNDVPVSWNLVDFLSTGSQYPPTTIPLTPANSQLNPSDIYAGVYGPNAWSFEFISDNPGVYYYDSFTADNNLFGPGVGGGTGQLYDGFGDPNGNWTAPDASGTFQLFVGALTALGVCKAFLGGRPASRR